MVKQVDNGELYLARYCGPIINGDRLRVEIRRYDPCPKGAPPPIADVSWADFKEILRLGQQLLEED